MMFQRQRKTKRQLQTKEQETFSFPLGCLVKHIEDAVESVLKPSILADCRPSFRGQCFDTLSCGLGK